MLTLPGGERVGVRGGRVERGSPTSYKTKMSRLTPVARKLRRQSTDAEQLLWSHLRSRQLEQAKWVRQYPIGPHIADFACRALKLVIELDGGHVIRDQVRGVYGYTG